MNAPIMYCAPCVKLMMLSMPNMTARPRLNSAENEPLIRPSSNCPNSACDGMPKISNIKTPLLPLPGGERECACESPAHKDASVAADQRTIAVFERTECFLRRNCAAQLV